MATWPTRIRCLCVLCFVWLLVLLTSWGCQRPPTIRARNVVIITLDTTRADHLSAYGPSRASTPTLDRLAREGVVFEQATSVAPLTLPAHCSLFTGLLPPHHGVRDNAADGLAADCTTLAEVLQRRGFQTAAFVGSAVLQANRGLSRGFDVYHDGLSEDPWVSRWFRRPANEVIDDALEWLADQTDVPVFVWIHLYDAHAPYRLPEPYDAMYADDLYAGAIAFADAQIGRFVDVLDRRHDLDRTALIVVGDHGESLGEHGEHGHGLFVYQEVLRVPLIVHAPGFTPGRVTAVTTLVDVMPTVLDLVGAPSVPLDGTSLLGLLTGTRPSSDREVYSESMYPSRFGWSPLRTVRSGPFKFIEAPRPELYDLESDPRELHNVLAEQPALASALAVRVAVLAGGSSSGNEKTDSEVTSATRRGLAALGYISGTATSDLSSDRHDLPDPKDRIAAYNELVRRLGVRTPDQNDD